MPTIDIINLRTLVAIFFALLFLFWIGHAVTHQGRGIVYALVCLLVAGPLGYFEYQWQAGEYTASKGLQKVYGNANLSLKCERFSDSLVDTTVTQQDAEQANPGLVWVNNHTCMSLLGWLGSSKLDPTAEQATAVYGIAAEGAKIAGDADVCAPLQHLAPFAAAIGASDASASTLAQTYYSNVWATTAGNPNCSVSFAIN